MNLAFYPSLSLLKQSQIQNVETREGYTGMRGGEQLASLSLGITALSFFPTFPNLELTGKLLSAFPECSQCTQCFLRKEPGLKNKNRRALEEEESGR